MLFVVFILIFIFGCIGLLVIIRICKCFFFFLRFFFRIVIFSWVFLFGCSIVFFKVIFIVGLNICSLLICRGDLFVLVIIMFCLVLFFLVSIWFKLILDLDRWIIGVIVLFCLVIFEKFGRRIVDIGILFFLFILLLVKWVR